MDFYSEASYLPKHWEALAISLLEYAKEISNSQPHWENEQWVFRPENFVTFRIQRKRKTGLTLYLRGFACEFLAGTVRGSVPGYSKIILDDYRQAPDTFSAIKRAYELYGRGRTRRNRTLRLVEE